MIKKSSFIFSVFTSSVWQKGQTFHHSKLSIDFLSLCPCCTSECVESKCIKKWKHFTCGTSHLLYYPHVPWSEAYMFPVPMKLVIGLDHFDLWWDKGQRKARPALLLSPREASWPRISRKFAFWYCGTAADTSSYIENRTLITLLSPSYFPHHCCDSVALSVLSLQSFLIACCWARRKKNFWQISFKQLLIKQECFATTCQELILAGMDTLEMLWKYAGVTHNDWPLNISTKW